MKGREENKTSKKKGKQEMEEEGRENGKKVAVETVQGVRRG